VVVTLDMRWPTGDHVGELWWSCRWKRRQRGGCRSRSRGSGEKNNNGR